MAHKSSAGQLHSGRERVRRWGDGEGENLTGDGDVPGGGEHFGSLGDFGGNCS
jgi:hypothetical protein